MEEEPKNITHTDEPKGQSSKRKPRITKTGNTDQRSVKNQKNMSHARSELQKYIHEGKKQKSKKEEPEEEEDEEIEVIFKSPAKLSGSAPPKTKMVPERHRPEGVEVVTPKSEEKETKFAYGENKNRKVKELEDLIGRYHSELSRISEKNKKLKKQKTVLAATPPPPPPTPQPLTIRDTDILRRKFLLRF